MSHVRYDNILTRLWGIRVTNCKFLVSFVSQLPEENTTRKFKEHTTKYRSLSWRPRSHAWILIYRSNMAYSSSSQRPNSPCTWWHRTNKFHHQASLLKCKLKILPWWTNSLGREVEKNCLVKITGRWQRFEKNPRKRGLVVNFERVT